MKKLLIFILFLICFDLKSQPFFNLRYDPNQSSCDGSWNLLVDSNQLIISYLTCTGPGFSGYRSASIAKMDLSGNVINNFNIIDSNYAWFLGGPGAMDKLDNGYIVSATKQLTDSEAIVALVRINEFGDTLWSKSYPNIKFSTGWCVRKAIDNAFFICGSTNVTDTLGNGLIIKTDSSGNLIWRKEIGNGFMVYSEKFYSLTPTIDGGCALVGRVRTLSGEFDIFVAKVDSGGNLEWDTTFFTDEFDEGWSIAPAGDSAFIIAGFYASAIQGLTYPFAAKFDYTGNLLWQRKYGDSLSYSGFYSIRALEDGNFILAGNYNPNSPPVVIYGMIYKISSDGDSIWSRYYNAGINSRNYLKDIYPVYDGGYIACGEITPFAPDTGNQDVWILRVDSMGCEIANCTISIEELNINNAKIFPNPAFSEITIELEEHKHYEVEIFDMMGKKILQIEFSGTATNISLSEFQAGMFLINVFDNHKRVFSRRVLKLNSPN